MLEQARLPLPEYIMSHPRGSTAQPTVSPSPCQPLSLLLHAHATELENQRASMSGTEPSPCDNRQQSAWWLSGTGDPMTIMCTVTSLPQIAGKPE